MSALALYLMEASATAILLYLFFRILMERETMHEYVRALWLGTMLLSLVLPLVRVPLPVSFSYNMEILSSSFVVGEPEMLEAASPGRSGPRLPAVLHLVYFTGVGITALIYLVAHIRLHLSMRRYVKTDEYNALLAECARLTGCRRKVKLYLSEPGTAPCSWMNSIMISREDIESDGRDIILHEMGHIRKGHSWDVLFSEIFTCLLWFNPVSWLIGSSLRQVHEYSADRVVLRSGVDMKEYQKLLIKKAVGTASYSIANSFNHNNLKNRITMMFNNQNGMGACVKSLVMLPLCAGLVLVFSSTKPAYAGEVSKNSPDQSSYVEQQIEEKLSYKDVEEKPKFMGGDANKFSQWVAENLTYPAEAKAAGISGRVDLEFTINTDGSVGDVKVLKGVSKELDEEAVRVISMSPNWTPGKVNGKPVAITFVFPIIFQKRGE